MNPAFILLAAMLLPISPAFAGNWHILQNTPQVLLEAGEPMLEASEDNGQDKTRKKDKKLKIWNRISLSHPEQANPGDFYYSSAKSLLAINCTKRTRRLMQKIYYTADGQEIKSVRYGEDERIESIVPDTLEERVFDFSCEFEVVKAAKNKAPKRAKSKSAKPRDSATAK